MRRKELDVIIYPLIRNLTKENALEQYTNNRRTDRRREDRRVAAPVSDARRRASGIEDRRASQGRREADRRPQSRTSPQAARPARPSGEMSHQERQIRRDRLRRQRERQARLRRKRMIVLTVMGLIAILVLGGIGYGIYRILDVDYVAEGTELFEVGDYANALIAFEEAVDKGDDLDLAYLGVAYCNWELGNYVDMSTAFDQAYLNGASVTGASRSILASLALEDEDYELALSYIQEGLALDGNSAELKQELLSNEITCYENLGEWDTAKAKMVEYLVAYPDDEDAIKEAEFLETR